MGFIDFAIACYNFLVNGLEFFKNVIEIIAVFLSVISFIYFNLNRFSKVVRALFAKKGLNIFSQIRIVFTCRKSLIKKRAFLEFAMLRTQGNRIEMHEWKRLINEFKNFFEKNETSLVYTIPNCSLLIEKSFSEIVDEYFTFFSDSKTMRYFGITDERIPWVLALEIDEAYVTPTCLLTGLLSKYEENWNEFINKYMSSVHITENETDERNCVLSNELYMTFAWLLWGPSYEIDCAEYWDGLCQISYGDESNSVPAIADRESSEAKDLREYLLDREDKHYGCLLSTQVRLYKCAEFYEKEMWGVSTENTYFYNKHKHGDFSFGIRMEDYDLYKNYKEKKYYCTAYVWVLFEVENEDDNSFFPERTVAFFEHSNLADTDNYLFLLKRVVEKSIAHFADVYSDKKYHSRKYRFICGMNDEIEDYCIERYEEEMKKDTELAELFRKNISLKKKRKAHEVFAGYDEFFSHGKSYSFVELDYANRNDISLLARFYAEIYIEAFPDDDEREKFDNLLYYLKNAHTNKEYRYHILLAKDDEDNVLAGCIFDYYSRRNIAAIEFIAVKQSVQSLGIGSELYQKVVSKINEDAIRHQKNDVDYIFCEMDSPDYSTKSEKKYLYFWNKNGYCKLDFKYIQPPLSESQAAVEHLWLAVASQYKMVNYVDSDIVIDFLYCYMKYSMKIDEPRENKCFKKMCSDLKKMKRVDVQKLPLTYGE